MKKRTEFIVVLAEADMRRPRLQKQLVRVEAAPEQAVHGRVQVALGPRLLETLRIRIASVTATLQTKNRGVCIYEAKTQHPNHASFTCNLINNPI